MKPYRSLLLACFLLPFLTSSASGAFTWTQTSGPASPTTTWFAPSNNFRIDTALTPNFNINGAYNQTFANNSFSFGDNIPGPYTGTGYAGQSQFFNQYTGGTYQPGLSMDVEIVGDPSAVRFSPITGDSSYAIKIFGNNLVESVKVTYSYEAPDGIHSPGWTGRQGVLDPGPTASGGIRPALYARVIAGVDDSPNTITFGDLNEVTGFPVNDTPNNSLFAQDEFYNDGTGPNDPNGFNIPSRSGFSHIAPTLGGGGTTASLTGDDIALWYHNKGDLGDLINSVSATFTPSGGNTFFSNQSEVRFSLDGMSAIIPEPSRASLLALGLGTLLLRRRRR